MLNHRASMSIVGVASAFYLLGLGLAQAESRTTAHTLSSDERTPAISGPPRSLLPLIDPSVFPVGGGDPSAAPTETPSAITSSGDAIEPQAVGSRPERWPYATARVAVTVQGNSSNVERTPVTSYPYRAAGKLWTRYGGDWFICTASLLRKGVLITAAHCVHKYGQGNAGFPNEVWFAPANTRSSQPSNVTPGQPYGWYRATKLRIFESYRVGTDTCLKAARGIVCNNDIATVLLAPNRRIYAGQVVGTFGYGINGFSSFASPAFGNGTVSAISQLGYPGAIDSGGQMIRNDSFGKFVVNGPRQTTTRRDLKNTQLGSAMTGGSSGGPWLVNFGTRPQITGGASLGSQSESNVVVNVTSWGYNSPVGSNVQGASWFGQNFEAPAAAYGAFGGGNIGKIMFETCSADPAYC